MRTFKIISTDSDITTLKTRSHFKTYRVHICSQSERIGYVSESTQSFNLDGCLIKSTDRIKSFYFGFPNAIQAERFEDFVKNKFPAIAHYGTNCVSRPSKRLTSPFEVKFRNLPDISKSLFDFFLECAEKEVSKLSHSEVKKCLARL